MVSSLKYNTYKKAKDSYAQNPIVRGDFPIYEDIKELPVFKFNRFLSSLVLTALVVSMVSYSMVAAKESAVSAIHSKTNEINYENIDLQNKVELAKSLNNINNKIQKVDYLKKADKVLEVKAFATTPIVKKDLDKTKIQPVSGY